LATRRSTSAKTAADRVVFIIIDVLPKLCVACMSDYSNEYMQV
jgi:hypothetical protein